MSEFGRFDLTREIVETSNPAIDAVALAAMRKSYNSCRWFRWFRRRTDSEDDGSE